MANEIFGTEFDDRDATALHGTPGDDIIYGLAGNDELYGGAGINIYIGGAGDDSFFGDQFADRNNHDIADYSGAGGPIYVYLDAQNGYVNGDASVGHDSLSYIDRIVGTAFDDVFDVGGTLTTQAHIEGGAGNDEINGNGYQTVVRYTSAAAGVTVDLEAGTAQSTEPGDAAGIGIDTLNYVSEVRGSDFGDTLLGSDTWSLETFRGRGGADTIDGRGGWDVADYSNAAGGVTVNLGANGLGNGVASDDGDGSSDILLNIEDVTGSDHADDITGDEGDNEIFGRGGADTINGAGGDDELIGGGGDDILIGGAGNDGMEGEDGDDTLAGGTGINFLGGGDGTDTAIFDGNRADYEIYQQIGSPFAEIVLIDTRTGLPEDTIHFTSSIENFAFADGTLDAASLGADFNTTPETASEIFVVRPGDIVTYNILANDFDADGDPLMLVDLDGWNWDGTETPITWDEAGNITFVVPSDSTFVGFEFYANVWDGKGGLAESTVTFQLTESFNQPPWAQPDIYPTPATDNLLFLGFTAESGPEFYTLGNDGALNRVTSSGLTGGVSQAEPYLFGDALYFMAYDPVSQKEQVWRGIDGEIELVTKLNNAGGGIAVESFVEFDGGLYFYASQAPSENPTGFAGGIFRIDDTGAVTQITEPPVLDPDFFYQPVVLGGNLVFGGFTEATGPQWWTLDTAGNVTQLSDYPATLPPPTTEAQIVFNGELYWNAADEFGVSQVYKINASGVTTPVTSINTANGGIEVFTFKEFGGNLYFHGNGHDGTGNTIGGIFKFDGTLVTQLTFEDAPGAFVGFFFPSEINGTLYYGAFDPVSGDEAWYSISGPAGETVTEIAAGPWPKVAGTGENILLHEDKIYWNGVDESGNIQVWVFDPLVGEDVIVSDVNSANGGIVVDRFYSFDGEVYFGSSTDGAAGIYKISDAGVVTQLVDSTQFGQPFGFFFPMAVGPDEPVLEGQTVVLDVLANDVDFDTQTDHGQTFVLVDVEITSVDGPYGVALGTGTASIVDNKLVFNQGTDFTGLADGQTATVTIAYTMRDTGGYEDSSYAQITITGSGAAATPILGTPNGEAIPGTPGDDVILADAGDDTITGNGGNDFIDGGEGTDTAVFARDFMDGNGYSVFLNNNGTVRVDAEGTTIDDGSVTLTNVEFLDFGGTIYNLILGDENENTLTGTSGNDLILGGGDDDIIQGSAGDDLMGGGTGYDTLSYEDTTQGVTVNLETGVASGTEIGNDLFGDFENLIGGSGNDILTGSQGEDEITGGGGDDIIDGQGDPWDVAFYSGNRADYLVTAGAPGWIVIQDLRDGSPDGTDTVTNIEIFVFNDNAFSIDNLIDLGGDLVANSDEGSVGENETKLFNVLANDQAPIGGVLALDSYTITSVTSDNFGLNGIDVAGLFGIVADQIEFNPGALFDQLNGTQSATITLDYTVSDGLGGFATAPLVITVNGENDAPVAQDTTSSTGEDDVTNIILPVFDVDNQFEDGTIEIVSQTGPGVVTPLSFAGSYSIDFLAAEFFDYLANGEQDVVTLTYRIVDAGGGVSNDAEVTITIFGANDTPIAENDFANATAGVTTTIDVLANDFDPDTNDTLTIVNAFSPNATIVIENGLLTYTADAGFSGEDMISYMIEDSAGAINFANAFVTVSGGNQNPVAVADEATVGENDQITIDVLGNDSDPDAGDVLSLTGINSITVVSSNSEINGIDAGSGFSVVGNQIQFDPGALFDALENGQSATVTVNYSISDGNGGISSAPLTLTVTGTNDTPSISGIGLNPTFVENGEPTHLFSNVSVIDVDNTAFAPRIVVTGLADGAAEQLIIEGTPISLVHGNSGSYNAYAFSVSVIAETATVIFGGVNDSAYLEGAITSLQYVNGSENPTGGSRSITVYAVDNGTPNQTSTTAVTATVDVIPVNDAPEAVGGYSGVILEDTVNTIVVDGVGPNGIPLAALATDVDSVLTRYSITAFSAALDGNSISLEDAGISYDPETGIGTIDTTAAAYQSLAEGTTGVLEYTHAVSDGENTVYATFTYDVIGANDAPIAQNAVGFGSEDAPVFAQLAVTDVDDPFGMGGTVEIISSTGAGGITVVSAPGGFNLAYAAEGDHDYLGVGESEEVSIIYRVTDALGGVSNEATVTLDIHGANDGPMANADEAEAFGSTPIQIDVLANDTDPDQNDVLTVINATAANGSVEIGEGGVLTYTAGPAFSGMDTIFYQIADGNGGFSDGTVTVNVTSDNAPPTVADVSGEVFENTGATFQLLGSDENPAMLTYNLVTPDIGAAIAGSEVFFFAGSEFDYLAVGETAEIVLLYTATDVEGLTSNEATITITVVGQNDLPLLEPIVMQVVDENTATAFLTLEASDLDTSDILTYAIAGGVDASFFSIDSATGALAFVTPPDFEAFADSDGDNVYIVDVSVSDGTATTMATVFAQVADLAGVNLSGTSGDDTLDGTVEDDTLSGLTGNDTLVGYAGNDLLLGLAGEDVLDGGDGDDVLIGGLGIDTILAGAGNDVIRIGAKEAIGESIDGGHGIDTIEVTGTGLLWLTNFSAAANSIETWFGNGAGILGGAENNTFDLAGLAGGETIGIVDGGAGDDVITGTSADDNLRGGSGDDQLSGGSGNDTISGGSGSDMTSGGAGDDTFVIAGTEAAGDTFDGGDGTDTISVIGGSNATLSNFDAAASSIEGWSGNGAGIFGTVANDRINLAGLTAISGLAFIDGSSGNDEITGSSFADDLRGGAGDDTLVGGDGDDALTGNTGADQMQGGAGNDRFLVAGSDAVLDSFDGGDGVDAIEVTGSSTLILSNFNAAASSVESWIGNTAGVIGTTGNDTIDFSGLTGTVSDLGPISGGNGADTLIGSGANDHLIGGAQNDMLIGGDGNDILHGGAGVDTLFGGAGDDTIIVERTFDISDGIDGGDGAADTLQVAGSLNVTLRDFDTTTNGMEIWQGNDAALVGTGAGNTFNLSGLTAVSGLSYVDGASGHDTIVGSAFADDLRGGSGNDQISGGGGIDIINGGTGNDILEGGAGDDLFLFNASWGRDQITDFETGDQIVFSGVSGLDDFGDLAQSIVSGNVQIAFGTNTITFVGQTAFLTTDDVSFT